MTEHDFSQLYEQYPTIIEQMEDEFTSHKFILKLAQQNQTQYVVKLFAIRLLVGDILPENMVTPVLV